ncbi:hypothetical protein EVU96_24410 [Bacillus infantis]|uniref:Flp pilus assembly protein CpaB n=1 Tax=Bacillus infantis TaxID=324767 RepID=UPI00101CCF29|nr:hypothetical protein [Bacillus infantis]RYI25293.1 hypothetical protein EVU96_24410 [Bacillus infantis]
MIDSKRKAIIFLTLSFLLALIAAGVILVQINQTQQKLGKTIAVAAASKDITSYHEIEESDIKWVELPQSSAYESFITDEKDLKEAITVIDLKEGDLLTSTLVRKKLDIPADERVVWLNATEIVLIDQLVAEGDLVDIIVTQEIKGALKTNRILENIPVVQVEEQEEGAPRIKISLSIDQAESVIHYQNSAVQIRVLRVNQAMSGTEELKKEEEKPDSQETKAKENAEAGASAKKEAGSTEAKAENGGGSKPAESKQGAESKEKADSKAKEAESKSSPAKTENEDKN